MLSKQEIKEMTEKALKNGWTPGGDEAEAKRMNEAQRNDPEALKRAQEYLEMSEQPKMSNQPQQKEMSPEGKKARQEYQKKVEQAADQYFPERQKQKPEMSK